jgi:putative cell wall-binding protein
VPGATVSRVSGLDRFEVSRNVLLSTLDGTRVFQGAADVYVANGYNYPDALVAGAAGSSADRRAPVLTIPGPLSIPLPSSTTSAIVNGGYSTIKIAGGPASVTPAIQTQLSNLSGSIAYRLGGLDRFEAARTVANNAYPQTASTVFIATGLNFPDALAGAPLAGMLDAPMFSVPTTCVPRGVLRDIERLRPTEIILLGGTGTLTAAVAALTPCP